ncbi:MAG: ABC transporter ATP-binding protein [Gammaproteobacteria bacterium]|nr:MAG: ABC transporter ATP-binding protein [Gammaproteobacteria bacterium]
MSTKQQSNSISIQNLSLSFGKTEVLKKIDLEIQAGEFFSFLGPSGSGKSTLLRAISGFGPTPSGSIKIGDDDITNLPAWRRNVGMVFQSYALWPHMSVRKNVAFGLEERKIAKKEINRLVDEALDLVSLKDLADRHPSQLSGGQQQRIALARTIVVKPRVLLLDEPLSNLDANLRVQMRRDILSLQRRLGLTTIFVTHDQEEANTISDRMAVLDDGIIQQIGSPVDLYDNPVNRFVASFLGSANIISGQIKNQQFKSSNNLTLETNIKKNKKCDLIIRPQSIDISTTKKQNKNSYQLTGQVLYFEFLGQTVRYFVEVQGHEFIIDCQHTKDKKIINNNEKVFLNITTDQILFL